MVLARLGKRREGHAIGLQVIRPIAQDGHCGFRLIAGHERNRGLDTLAMQAEHAQQRRFADAANAVDDDELLRQLRRIDVRLEQIAQGFLRR